MVCPACNVVIHLSYTSLGVFVKNYQDFGIAQPGYKVVGSYCPNCGELIVFLRKGECEYLPDENGFNGEMSWQLINEENEELIYPQIKQRTLSDDIPTPIKKEYIKAQALVKNNPTECVLSCRRIIENILRNVYKIDGDNLGEDISNFKRDRGLPSIIYHYIDYVRIFGNIAAHNDIYDNENVEAPEANKILEITYAFIDYAYLERIRNDEISRILRPKILQWQNGRRLNE